jgi:hypothetical protein
MHVCWEVRVFSLTLYVREGVHVFEHGELQQGLEAGAREFLPLA